jgi:beta-mannanase
MLLAAASHAATPIMGKFSPPAGDIYLGVSTDWDRLDKFDQVAGLPNGPAIYGRWTTPDGDFQPILDQVAQRPGLTPMVTWNLPLVAGQVTDGSHDAYITAQANEVKAFGKPVFIRLDWEMNAYWYPNWNLSPVTPAEYVASWRHVVDLFNQAGVTNAAFVWCPNVGDYFSTTGARTRTSAWYPGDDVVDWVGLDAYPQSNTPDNLLNETDGMNQMANFALAHGKPMMLAEWAPNTPHPDTADPINLVFNWAQANSAVQALVYFDFITQGKDFTLADHPVGAATYQAWTTDKTKYLTNVVGAQ